MKKFIFFIFINIFCVKIDAQCVTGSLELKLDNYPSETSWTIKNSSGTTTLYSGSGYNQGNQVLNIAICLTPGQNYIFQINDSYGDGICCSFGQGYYKIKDNAGNVLTQGGAFSYTDAKTFFYSSIGSSCSDGIQNGSETGIDCGGSCMPCQTGGGTSISGTLELKLDNYPSETSWAVKNASGTITLFSGSGYNQSNQIINIPIGLTIGQNYLFQINDTYGDGICCSVGQGYYKIKDNVGNTIIQGGAFTFSDVRSFCFMCTAAGPTCVDGIQNGNETGIDCGGSCTPCPTSVLCETPLPTTLPDNQAELAIANSKIACAFSPTIRQLAEADLPNSHNGTADLITSVYYDGDAQAGNNWDNLVNYSINHPALNPVVYYSVVWTAQYWIVTYAFYHPRDYSFCSSISPCRIDNHENDMEGVMYVVNRATNQIVKAAAISHNQLLASCNSGNNIVSIDNRSHACRIGIVDFIADVNPCDDIISFSYPHIVYTRGTISSQNLSYASIFDASGVPHSLVTGTASYILEDIFKIEPNGLWNIKNILNNGIFFGNTFIQSGSGDCQESGSLANGPWGWDQFNHSNTNIDNLLLSNQCSNLSSPMVYNPYISLPLPICSYPKQVVTTQVTDVSLSIDWENIVGATEYQVYFRKYGEWVWNNPTITTSSNILIENLLPNTTYQVKVTTSCNENYTLKDFTTSCIECACNKPIMNITSSQVLIPAKIDGDIIIKNGATLTINKLTKFNLGSKILVEQGGKLIATGANTILTSCHPTLKWLGVTLVGDPFYGQTNPWNPTNGIIEMSNGATIENAEIGINSSYTTSSGNLGTYTWSGGIVRLNNATIKNCLTGVKFGPYGLLGSQFDYEDISYITSSAIMNCNTGVILESNVGVDFISSTITNNYNEGIKSINSKINVNSGCNFTNNTQGIAFYNSWPSVYF
jgi:hypothetical protein